MNETTATATAITELLKLIRALLRAQIEEGRINSFVELEGTIKRIDEGLVLLGAETTSPARVWDDMARTWTEDTATDTIKQVNAGASEITRVAYQISNAALSAVGDEYESHLPGHEPDADA